MPKAKRTGGQEEAIPPSKKGKPTRPVGVQKPVKKGILRKGKARNGSTGLTEIVEELSMDDPGSPMVLDTENSEDNNVGWNGSGADDGIKLSPQAVNDRLRQARKFLSHEDANRHVEFARRHEKIDGFLRLIANEKIGCDVLLYTEVQAMVEVHRSRMNRQKAHNIERSGSRSRMPQSDRLSLYDTIKQGRLLGAPLRDDHPPFTLERPADQNLFIKALHGPSAPGQSGVTGANDRRAELTKHEIGGFLETLQNPSLVHEPIEERESQTRDERFNARATKRGRRRAAIRLALRSFATNSEQHYKGRWDRCDFRLPSAPAPQTSGRKIVFDKAINARWAHEKPFSWTQKYEHWLRVQKDRPQGEKKDSVQEFARPLNGNRPIPTEKQARELLRAEIMKESQRNKPRVEVTNDNDWASPVAKTGVGKRYFSLNRWSGTTPNPTAGNSTRTFEGRPEILDAENLAAPEVGEEFSVLKKAPVPEKRPEGRGNAHIREKSQVQGKSPVPEKLKVQKKSQIQRSSPRDQGLLEIAKSQEKIFRGDTTFTFAETPFLQAVTSKWIERDLGSGSPTAKVSKVIQLPSQKFALPEPAYNPQEAVFDPRSGHLHHIRHAVQRQTTRLRTESLPKVTDDKTKIAKTRAGVPTKEPGAPFNRPDLSYQSHKGRKKASVRDDPDRIDIVEEETTNVRRSMRRR